MKYKITYPVLLSLLGIITHSLVAQSVTTADRLVPPATVFRNPPESAKPGVLWMWMGANLSKEGITKDLEALKKEGFNRTTMFSLADVTTPWACDIGKSPTPELISWTEPWWKLVRHAAEESKRLGMDFGMFNGPSYESSGGVWITPELSMQEICSSQTKVTGNQKTTITLAQPTVKLRGHTPFPVYNPKTGLVEKPEIEARRTYYKDIAVLALPATGPVTKANAIELTGKMKPSGELVWDAPAGDWVIYRFGHTTTGTLIQPAQWQATGLECDKMSQQAVDFHMDHVIGEIQKHLGDLIGTGFTHVHFDSYEAGNPTWTPRMREEFTNRRGYDPLPYLVAFAGRRMGSQADSVKFRKDFEATIKDLHRDIYFTTISKKLKAANLTFLCEPYGGPWRQDEVMPLVHNVMTEFWTHGGKYAPYELEPTVAALRKSGQNIVEAEAFTGDPKESPWNETPAWLKPIGDAAFCAGVNRMVLHRFVQQPWDDRYKPGATMGRWGTHFDRTQTWWEPGKALVAYWQRCQALLQWGRIAEPVANDFSVISSSKKDTIKAIHRYEGTTDIYFVANTAREPRSTTCTFKVANRQPELWDPVTGAMRPLTQFESKNGMTTIPLKFAEAQSFFIVFQNKATAPVTPTPNFADQKEVAQLAGAWQVRFDPAWGGPTKPVTFAKLDDWTTRPEAGIKYFSGTAVYRQSFDVAPAQLADKAGATYLDLGVVNHVARVFINNQDLGVVWTAPWRIQIPAGLLKAKENQVVVEVTNVWANRLIGDEQEPADQEWLPGHLDKNSYYLKEFPDWFLNKQPRPSKGRYCFTTWNYFTKDSPLIPSGLLGPVRIMREL
ncbi:glycosyl hydrolase [Spirosoma soli]|uniref:Glycosyl hydrolase n=1 Tax=Spirosoma soli TaxID=1770529 RepID=A0ABW5M7M4_9BACT